MKKKSISLKLFVMMILTFSFFIGLTLYFQTLFFERFYLDRKYVALEKSIEEFVTLYRNSDWNKYNLDRQAKAFKNSHSITLGVFDSSYTQLNDDVYEVVVEDYSGQIFRVRLGALLDNKEFMVVRPKPGDRIEAEGTIWNDKREYLTPIRVTVNSTLWFDYKKHYGYQRTDMLDKISGKVVISVLPTTDDLIHGTDRQLSSGAFNYWLAKNNYNANALTDTKFIYYDRATKIKCTVFVKIMEKDDGKRFVLGIVPHQAVLEAIEIMKEYYLFVFLAAILVVGIMSYAVSLMISRPLIHINRVATKIAHLDFTEKLKASGNDEIGSLSNSLNLMADSLEKNLEDLKEMNEKLMEDIQRERQLENMRKDFINGVSHELKTPLGIMKSYAEALKDGIGKNKQDHYTTVILEEIDRMDDLIMDMLEISRLQSGTYKLRLERHDLRQLVESIGDRMSGFMKDKGMSLKINSPEHPIYVVADGRTFELVINNLMSNAVRYGRVNGQIEVTMMICSESSQICFYIENEGENISEEKMDKIWDKFYRLEPSRSKDNGGSGLGLAIVKNILELHGSQYGVKNTERGVVFYFELKGGALDEEQLHE